MTVTMIQMTHPGISGEVSAPLDAFNVVWEPLGWVLVEPEDDVEYLPAPMRYVGSWGSGVVYSPGDAVSHSDSVWVANEPSLADEPGVDPEWVAVGLSSIPPGTYPYADPVVALTYNGDGTVATSTENGITTTFTYNGDLTVATTTRLGVTRTYSYNGDGTLAAVA